MSIAGYFLFAALYNVGKHPDDTLVLYSFTDQHTLCAVLFALGAATCLATAVVPKHIKLRWIFFVCAGFILTGRLVSWGYPRGAVISYASVGRVSLFVAALLAHLVIQIDWMAERDRDD